MKKISYSWTGRINVAQMTIGSEIIYRYPEIPIETATTVFTELSKSMLKWIRKQKRPK